MAGRLATRRIITVAGIYGAAVVGFLGTVVAARSLGPHGFGLLSIVLAAQGFFQLFLDLSVGEAVVKYGYRYQTAEDWGRFRRLLGVAVRVRIAGAVLGGLGILALVPFARGLFGAEGLGVPLAIAALLPLTGFPVALASSVVVLRGRYELHGIVTLVAMLGRLAAMAIGSQISVTATVVALVIAQAASSAVVAGIAWSAYRRFPRAAAVPLGEDAAPLRRFVTLSTIGTTLESLRSVFPPLLLGIVATPVQVAFFRAAQAPQAGFSVLSAPVRIILLTEHTREVEEGRYDRVASSLRRYVAGATALMLVVVPPALWLMPHLVRFVYGADYEPATSAARLILLAAAIQVVYGWTKSFPVSIGRPKLRVAAQAAEIAVLVPALVVLGSIWAATGAGAAVVAGIVAFALTWTVFAVRLRREWRERVATGAVAP